MRRRGDWWRILSFPMEHVLLLPWAVLLSGLPLPAALCATSALRKGETWVEVSGSVSACPLLAELLRGCHLCCVWAPHPVGCAPASAHVVLASQLLLIVASYIFETHL